MKPIVVGVEIGFLSVAEGRKPELGLKQRQARLRTPTCRVAEGRKPELGLKLSALHEVGAMDQVAEGRKPELGLKPGSAELRYLDRAGSQRAENPNWD